MLGGLFAVKTPYSSRRTGIPMWIAACLSIALALFVPLAGSAPVPTFATRLNNDEAAVSADHPAWLSAAPVQVLPTGATGLFGARLAASDPATRGDSLPAIRPLLGGIPHPDSVLPQEFAEQATLETRQPEVQW